MDMIGYYWLMAGSDVGMCDEGPEDVTLVNVCLKENWDDEEGVYNSEVIPDTLRHQLENSNLAELQEGVWEVVHGFGIEWGRLEACGLEKKQPPVRAPSFMLE